MKLNSHPRLYVGTKELARLQRPSELPFLTTASAWVAKNASHWAQMPPLTFNPDTHNAHLVRAREVQTRVLTLLARWQQTNNTRYRNAALEYVRIMGSWECWSWLTWRQKNYRPTAIFDLSYGENSATLALAYDLLCDTLTAAEKQLFLDIAIKWPVSSGEVHCRPHAAWWFGKADCNWNTVCAGGLGMLCLALYDDIPLCRRLLPRVEKSFGPFMHNLDKTSGAWPEGTGYWNYGMLYAFMYLLSWENSTGRRHPLMQLQGVRKTLEFPLDFSPNAQPCSFGDGNSWTPLPFHYAVAHRLKAKSTEQGIDARLQHDPQITCRGGWASAAGWLLFHDDRLDANKQSKPLGVKLYQGLDWAVLADRQPEPKLYMSIRGGTTMVPHGHCDLMSYNMVVKDEKLIGNEGNAEYLDTTFSSRRYDLPDINAQFKNTILINGVGVFYGAALNSTRVFNHPKVSGVRMEGTAAMGSSRGNEAAISFCGRLVLLLHNKAFLIIDRAMTKHPARMESRLHTHAKVAMYRQSACLHGKREKLRLAYASTVPGLLVSATTAPTTPTAETARMLRWCTRAIHTDMTLITLAVPGTGSVTVDVKQLGTKLAITAKTRSLRMRLDVSKDLKLLNIL